MAAAKAKKQSTPKSSDVLVLFGTIADTTWRMFIPIIGLMLLGDVVDRHYDTRPWYALGGVVVGSVIAGWLVIKQLHTIKKK